jgi:hypothetical protein
MRVAYRVLPAACRRRARCRPMAKRRDVLRRASQSLIDVMLAASAGAGLCAGMKGLIELLMGHFCLFLASQAFIALISASWALMMSSANLRISGSLPYFISTCAMSIAPW